MKGLLWLVAISFSLLLNGCGYRGESESPILNYQAITVPFVDGDEDGSLTSAIVRAISTSCPIPYSQYSGDLILRAKILDIDEDNVGYRYDRKKSGEIRKRLVPCETRLTVQVEVSVENRCGQQVLPKVIITANEDFDHDYYSSRNEINIFSLGQLSEVDAARDTVISPVNALISKKIVDYLSDSW